MLTTEIKEMPVNKRIILMEKIWDSLCHKRKEIDQNALNSSCPIQERHETSIGFSAQRFLHLNEAPVHYQNASWPYFMNQPIFYFFSPAPFKQES